MFKEKRRKRIISAIITFAMMATLLPTGMLGAAGMEEVKAANPNYEQIAIKEGFNADVFAESQSVLRSTQSCESTTTAYASNTNCFYTVDCWSSGGFPSNGWVTDNSGKAPGLAWQLGAYNANNAMRLTRGSSGTFTFNTVGVYQKLYFLCSAGGVGVGHDASMPVTVYYSDGSTSVETFTVVDWYDSFNYARMDFKRSNGSSSNGSTSGGPYITRCAMDIDTTKLIQKITIKNAASSNVYLCVYAVTGMTGDLARPNTPTMVAGCSSLTADWNDVAGADSYRIDIATDNKFQNIVGTYNNTYIKDSKCTISGLQKGTTYYLRVRAADKNGAQGPSSTIVTVTPIGHTYGFNTGIQDKGNLDSLENPNQNTDTFNMYCTVGVCEHYSDDANEPEKNALKITLNAKDVYYDRNRHPASFDNSQLLSMERLLNVTGQSVELVNNEIKYYKTETKGSTVKGDALSGAPRDIGHYIAEATFKDNNNNLYTIQKSYSILKEYANYDYEEIENENYRSELYGDDNLKDAQRIKVDLNNSNTLQSDLQVYLSSEADKITLYKLADVNWNTINEDYDDPVWVPEVAQWVANATDKDGKKLYTNLAYSSPYELRNADSHIWKDFYSALVSYGVTHVEPAVGEDTSSLVTDYKPVTDADNASGVHISPITLGDKVQEHIEMTGTETEDNEYKGLPYTRFNNLPFGTYAIVAEVGSANTTRKFTPVIVNIVPDRSSPWGAYYIDPVFYAYLKDTGATIDKTINDKKQDTIHTGEEVSFTVNMALPTLYADRCTAGPEDQKYTLEMVDILSDAYSEVKDLKLEFMDKDGNFREYNTTNLPGSDAVAYSVFSSTTASGYKQIKAAADKETGYVLADDSTVRCLDTSINTALAEKFYKQERGAIVSGPTPTPKQDGTTEIKVTFNPAALKAYCAEKVGAEKGLPNEISDLFTWRLTYKATVTDKARVGAEGNTNRAAISYERNATGTNIGMPDDIVSGYTYGLRLIKRDGNTDDTIAGAQFRLFREICTYEKSGSTYTYKESFDQNAPSEYETLDIANLNGDTYYKYEYVDDNGTTNDTSDDHTYVRVFIVLTEQMAGDTKLSVAKNGVTNVFESVRDEEGILVKGLDTGNYVLTETRPVNGYNNLSDDMLFTITRLTADEQNLKYHGSLIAFHEGDAIDENEQPIEENINESGILRYVVYNYAGIVLPSTGGAGVWIFIVIGIALMGTATYIIIKKRNE